MVLHLKNNLWVKSWAPKWRSFNTSSAKLKCIVKKVNTLRTFCVVNLLTKVAAFTTHNAGNCFSNLSKKICVSLHFVCMPSHLRVFWPPEHAPFTFYIHTSDPIVASQNEKRVEIQQNVKMPLEVSLPFSLPWSAFSTRKLFFLWGSFQLDFVPMESHNTLNILRSYTDWGASEICRLMKTYLIAFVNFSCLNLDRLKKEFTLHVYLVKFFKKQKYIIYYIPYIYIFYTIYFGFSYFSRYLHYFLVIFWA